MGSHNVMAGYLVIIATAASAILLGSGCADTSQPTPAQNADKIAGEIAKLTRADNKIARELALLRSATNTDNGPVTAPAGTNVVTVTNITSQDLVLAGYIPPPDTAGHDKGGNFHELPGMPQKREDYAGRPRIHSLGDSDPVLICNPGAELDIAIRGQDLQDVASDFSVDVRCATNLTPGIDYWLDRTNPAATPALIFLRISKNVAASFATGDQLSVNINVSDKTGDDGAFQGASFLAATPAAQNFQPTAAQIQALQSGQIDDALARAIGRNAALAQWAPLTLESYMDRLPAFPGTNTPATGYPATTDREDTIWREYKRTYKLLQNTNNQPPGVSRAPHGKLTASISRSFSLFTSADYRTQVLKGEVQLQNITAYPLDFKESQKMFGNFVAANFYAVRLTLHNPTADDQFISLGAVKAYGQAIVFADDTNTGPAYTFPITMSPQSEIQIYTMVQSAKSGSDTDAVRDWVFGSLDFVGALATAYGTGFGASEDYIKAVAMATGVAIPGLGKLWEDKRPFHLLNINNFAMPDVVKVPKGGGSLDEKYLFFSKGALQGVLQDPGLSDLVTPAESQNHSTLSKKFSAPPISLEFDSLQIPFENTYAAATGVTSNTPSPLPGFTTDLTNQLVDLNTSVTLAVVASGTTPFAYQWNLAGTNLPGQTQSTLVITNCAANNLGTYFVVVTNALGGNTSHPATLTMIHPPVMTALATSPLPGGSTSLNVTATGDQPLHFYWYSITSATPAAAAVPPAVAVPPPAAAPPAVVAPAAPAPPLVTNLVQSTTMTNLVLPATQTGEYSCVISNNSIWPAVTNIILNSGGTFTPAK